MTEFDQKRIASAAAKEALQEFMLMLGVDISTPAGIIDLQDDFRHVRSLRLTARAVRNEIGSKMISVLTGSAVTGVIAAIGFYLTHALGK